MNDRSSRSQQPCAARRKAAPEGRARRACTHASTSSIPYTNTRVGTVPMASVDDVRDAFEYAANVSGDADALSSARRSSSAPRRCCASAPKKRPI